MSSAEVVDLRDYRERRDRRLPPLRPSDGAHRDAGLPSVVAVPFPVPFVIGWFPFWIVVAIPVAVGPGHA